MGYSWETWKFLWQKRLIVIKTIVLFCFVLNSLGRVWCIEFTVTPIYFIVQFNFIVYIHAREAFMCKGGFPFKRNDRRIRWENVAFQILWSTQWDWLRVSDEIFRFKFDESDNVRRNWHRCASKLWHVKSFFYKQQNKYFHKYLKKKLMLLIKKIEIADIW